MCNIFKFVRNIYECLYFLLPYILLTSTTNQILNVFVWYAIVNFLTNHKRTTNAARNAIQVSPKQRDLNSVCLLCRSIMDTRWQCVLMHGYRIRSWREWAQVYGQSKVNTNKHIRQKLPRCANKTSAFTSRTMSIAGSLVQRCLPLGSRQCLNNGKHRASGGLWLKKDCAEGHKPLAPFTHSTP